MADEAPQALWMALDAVAYLDDPRTFQVPDDQQRASARATYSDKQILDLHEALAWGIAHPDHDFAKQFGPMIPPIKHDKTLVIDYFKKLHQGLAPLVDDIRAKRPSP